MKHISLAFAGVVAGSLALSAQAGTSPWWSETFSGYSYDIQAMTNDFTKGTWNMKPEDGSSLAAAYSNDCYSSYYGVEHPVPADVLVLNTEGQELTFAPAASTNETSDVTVVDADVFFVGSDSEPAIVSNDVQFALFLKVSEDANPASNAVMVYVSTGGAEPVWVALDGTSGVADKTWHHVQVKINYDTANGSVAHVYIDGAEKTPQAGYTIANNARSATGLNSVSFKGTGAVDNFTGGYEVADVLPEHTFTASAYVDGVLDTTLIVAAEDIQAGTDASFEVPRTVSGTKTITNIVVKALETGSDVAYAVTDDGTNFTVTPAGLDFDASDPAVVFINVSTDDAATTGEAQTYLALEVYYGEEETPPEPTAFQKYFPEAQGSGTALDPYQIPNVAALKALQAAVASNDVDCIGACYVQTADIDMSSAGAFAGIGTYSKVPTSGTPFTGTYNGQGYTIANVTRAGGNTQGIFNQVGPSGVIENLVVSNMVFDAGVTGEYGFAIVGNAGGGATLRNLTAAGVFGSAEKPSTHNMAGIVVRLSPGATTGAATTVDSCTNNATIYGGYTKLGGINAIVQDQTGFKDGKVVFVNCANNGTLVCKRTAAQAQAANGAVTGNAGIVGYFSGTNVELTGCYGNGAITNADGANTDKDGALVGWTYGGTIKDNGGNSAPSNKKMIGTWGSATETGFQYATVDNGVATTIAPPYTLAAGGIYLLEGNAAPTIELAAGDSVTFDTALGYTLTDTGITAATGLVLEDSTSGTATTYSARALATPTVTVNGGANATAAWTVNGNPTSAPATLTEGDTYEVVYTADAGYKFADGATTTTNGTAGTENIVITISDAVALATPTVTVNGGANATAAWTVNGVSTNAPATLTEGDTYTVTYTADAGYEFAIGATTYAEGTAGTENIVIEIADAVAQSAPEPEKPSVNPGTGLAAYNTAHGTTLEPIAVTGSGFTMNFATTAPGTYTLMIATAVDGEYTESLITQTVTSEQAAAEGGALVTLTDTAVTGAGNEKKFYKIGWTAPSAN